MDFYEIVEEQDKRVIVPEITLKLNGHTHYALNSLMSTDVIPNIYYNISENKDSIHYIPFCHKPVENEFTSAINLSRIDSACIYLSGLESKKYNVFIMMRYFNTFSFLDGKLKTKW